MFSVRFPSGLTARATPTLAPSPRFPAEHLARPEHTLFRLRAKLEVLQIMAGYLDHLEPILEARYLRLARAVRHWLPLADA